MSSNPLFFTVEADFRAFVEDAASDSDYDPQSVAISGTVTFTPLLNTGDLVLATAASPRPTGFIPAAITAIIDSADGRLKLRKTTDSGATGYTYAPVRLLADSPLLELDGPLFYSVTFSGITYTGTAGTRQAKINGFTFQAPTTDSTLNLVTVMPQTGTTPGGITKIAPGGVRIEDGNIIFSFAGVDIPDPISVSNIQGASGVPGASGSVGPTGPAGATGASGASGSPGSSGSVGPTGPAGASGASGAVGARILGKVATYSGLPSVATDFDAWVNAADGLLYIRVSGQWPADGQGVPWVGPPGSSFSTLIGDGQSTSIAVAHNLNTRAVTVGVYDTNTWAEVECDVTLTSNTTATLTFATAPGANAYLCAVVSGGSVGASGAPGPQFFFGEGEPNGVVGASPGDIYIDTLTGQLFVLGG